VNRKFNPPPPLDLVVSLSEKGPGCKDRMLSQCYIVGTVVLGYFLDWLYSNAFSLCVQCLFCLSRLVLFPPCLPLLFLLWQIIRILINFIATPCNLRDVESSLVVVFFECLIKVSSSTYYSHTSEHRCFEDAIHFLRIVGSSLVNSVFPKLFCSWTTFGFEK
jgi:hypothetical protein